MRGVNIETLKEMSELLIPRCECCDNYESRGVFCIEPVCGLNGSPQLELCSNFRYSSRFMDFNSRYFELMVSIFHDMLHNDKITTLVWKEYGGTEETLPDIGVNVILIQNKEPQARKVCSYLHKSKIDEALSWDEHLFLNRSRLGICGLTGQLQRY